MEVLIQSLTLGLISSSFSLFLSFCYGRGELFSFWGLLLSKMPTYLAKPLGSCVYCQSTWIALCLCLCYANSPLVYMGAIGLNYIFLDTYFKIFLNE